MIRIVFKRMIKEPRLSKQQCFHVQYTHAMLQYVLKRQRDCQTFESIGIHSKAKVSREHHVKHLIPRVIETFQESLHVLCFSFQPLRRKTSKESSDQPFRQRPKLVFTR